MRASNRLLRAVTICFAALSLCSAAWADEPTSDDLGFPPLGGAEPAGPLAGGAATARPLAFPSAPALPRADEPPPPPPPPPAPADEPPAVPESGGIPTPDDAGRAPTPAELVPADAVAPTQGLAFERVPAGPVPWPQPTGSSCIWLRDDCGRPLDWCGDPIGSWDVTIEATGTDLEDPSGPLGEGRLGSLTWGGHDYDPEFGGRITIGYVINRTDRLEIRAGWSGRWRDDSDQAGVFGFSPPAGGTSPPVVARLRSRAELLGGEATWWRELLCCGTWRFLGGAGYRFVSFDESATFDAFAPLPLVGFAHARSENTFHLGQLAVAVQKRLGRRIQVGLSGKALLGSVTRDVNVSDANVLAGGAHASRSEESDLAWGAELELSVFYDLTARISLTAGYTLVYLDAVVRADDGMDFSQAATGVVQARQGTDSLLSQSVFAGIRFRF